MPQQSSQSVEQQFDEREINASWVIQDVEDNPDLNQSPSTINIQRHSKTHSKNKNISRSSIKSKNDLIRVSICNQPPVSLENAKEHQTSSITGISKRQCRICLEDQAEGRLVKPCKCIGSMQYTHQHCLCEWIKRKINFKSKLKVHCQVCEEPFNYKISKRLSLSWQILKQNYEKNRSNYICFIVVMSIMLLIWLLLALLTFLSFTDSSDNWVKQYIMQAEQTRVIFVCIILVYLLILSFVSLLFLAEYGVRTQLVVKNVQNYSKRPKKVVPKLYFIAT